MSEKNKAQLLSSLATHINEVTVGGVQFKGNVDLANSSVKLNSANLIINGAEVGKVLTAGASGAIVWTDAVPANVVTTTGGRIDAGILPTTVVQTVDGFIPASVLPSYVDDVVEVANTAALPATGETGKIYVELDTGKIKRWSGSVYVEINSSVGMADTANKLATPRTITSTGDVGFEVSFDGSTNVSAAATLADVGTAGTYNSVTVDAKGRVTSGTNVEYATAEDAFLLDSTSTQTVTANVAFNGNVSFSTQPTGIEFASLEDKPTTLAGYGITDGKTTMTTFKFSAGSTGNVTFTGSDLSSPAKTLLVSPDKILVTVNGVQQQDFTVVDSGNVTVNDVLSGDEVVITSFNTLNIVSVPYSAITGAPTSSGGASSLDGLSDAATDTTNMMIGRTAVAGEYNTSLGIESLKSSLFSEQNTAIGASSLYSNTTGSWNTGCGCATLRTNTTGNSNTAIGASSLYSNTTGSWNTAIGAEALWFNTVGHSNTANGANALKFNTEGFSNTANGGNALFSNTTGHANTANGGNALFSNTTGYANTAIGTDALYSNITGYNNTAIGAQALQSSGTWSGDNNTAIGAGSLQGFFDGSKCTAIGAATTFIGTGTNVTLIGYGATTETYSNEVTIGNDDVTYTRLKGKVSAKTFFSNVITNVTAFEVDKADVFTSTVSGATTFSVTGTPASGLVCSFVLELTNGGSGTITWWGGIKWAGGVTPTWTTTGVDLIKFYTHDGGTTWRASVLALDSK